MAVLVYRTVVKVSESHCPKPTKIHSETRGFGSKSKKKRSHSFDDNNNDDEDSNNDNDECAPPSMCFRELQHSWNCSKWSVKRWRAFCLSCDFVSYSVEVKFFWWCHYKKKIYVYKHQLKVARRLTDRLEASFQMSFYLLCIIQSLFNTVHKVVWRINKKSKM